MYGDTVEAADYRRHTLLDVIQTNIGPCREWPEDGDRCNQPAEYVLWGKLIPPEGLGPRCYDCAAKHVGHRALTGDAAYALINLNSLVRDIDAIYRALLTPPSKDLEAPDA